MVIQNCHTGGEKIGEAGAKLTSISDASWVGVTNMLHLMKDFALCLGQGMHTLYPTLFFKCM